MNLKHLLMDEANDGTGGSSGGGGEGDLSIDIDAVSDKIGGELGLGDDSDKGDLDLDTATPSGEKKPATPPNETPEVKAAREARERATAAQSPAAKAAAAAAAVKAVTDAKAALTAKKVDFTGKTDAEILALAKPEPKAAPKAWGKEHHETFSKLPPEAQNYILQRESQVEEGFKANASAVRYAQAVFGLLEPHQGLLNTQGIKNHVEFLNNMVQAHVVLSSQPDTARYPYIAGILRNYGLDPAKVAEAFAAGGAAAPQMTQAERDMKARLDKIENDKKTEQSERFTALKAESARDVEAFASDPAHPFFDEVAGEVSLLLADPKITLPVAYEMAVYANPVTRAKELARLKTEAEKTAREEADKAAAAAVKAKGTKVKGEERHRESPDLLGSIDDTLRETLKTINSRT